jgi:hypothetical protein
MNRRKSFRGGINCSINPFLLARSQSNFFSYSAFNDYMKQRFLLGVFLLTIGIAGELALAQTSTLPQSQDTAPSSVSSVAAPVADLAASSMVLEWTPPVLAELSAQATSKSSFTLDRTMLTAASSLLSDADKETRQAIAEIDGVSVHVLRFGPAGIANESFVKQIREAYRQRGWKHLVSNSAGGDDAQHNSTTDLWMVLDGINVRGAVVLVETPKSLTLVTLAGNLSPVDLLHLRGHFGIPRFNTDGFKDAKDK